MVSRYQVEPGRVCLINYGPSTGEVVVIVDFVDSRTVLVTGETRKRCTMPLSRLQLTKHRLPILQGAKNKTVFRAIGEYELSTKLEPKIKE